MDLANHMKLPRLDAKMDYTLNSLTTTEREALEDAYKSGRASWSVWVEFEMPFGNDGAKAEFYKYRLDYERAKEKLRRIQHQITTEIFSTTSDVFHSEKQIETAKRALQASERVLESEEASYELGQTANDDLLQSQDAVNSAQKEYLRTIVNYNVMLAKNSRIKGILLEDYNIKINQNSAIIVSE